MILLCLGKLNDSNYETNIIDICYDKKFKKNYIILGIKRNVISYDFNENKIYHKYYDNMLYFVACIIFNFKENNSELMATCKSIS